MMLSVILNRHLLTIVVFALLLSAGIIALTQELDVDSSESNEKKTPEISAQTSPLDGNEQQSKQVRWFRSNSGGMALEEMGSRFTALRHEYALSIDHENYKEFHEMLFQYNTGNYNTEIRTLYRNGEIIRTQWILRDKKGTTRVNAVIIEPKKEEEQAAEDIVIHEKPAEQDTDNNEQLADNDEQIAIDNEQLADNAEQLTENNGRTAGNGVQASNNNRRTTRRNRQAAANAGQTAENGEYAENGEQVADNGEHAGENTEHIADNSAEEADGKHEIIITEAEVEEMEKIVNLIETSRLIGFIEEFDEKSFLTCEIRLYENGSKDRIEYKAKDNLIITASVFTWDENKKDVAAAYTDHYRYNRSLSLRSVEREFLKQTKLDDEYLIITFPRRIMDAVNEEFLKSQRQNILPEFFGDIYAQAESRIIYESDARGRIISQTYYDENDKIVWMVKNTWSNDRITSTVKTEGDSEYTARFEYTANGDRVTERNYRNGVLERVVHSEGKTDIEELYFKNVLILRAVWIDGKKISEERVR